MTFAPILPVGGIAGLRFLDRTFERQFAVFTQSPEIQRTVAAFEERASTITTLDGLMADREVLQVVLGAFGLEEDLDKRAFVRKVLEEGSLEPRAFANRLADPAYRDMAAELGFGDLGGRLVLTDVRERLVRRYETRAFERAVGEGDVDLRLALTFRREIARISASETAETTGWLRVVGSQPLRRVVELAYGLPQQFGLLDIDRQVADLEAETRRRFGVESPAAFLDGAAVEEVLSRFLLRAQIERGIATTAAAAGPTAVQILQAGGLGTATSANLFAARLL